MEDDLFTIKIGTIILATGYETFPIEGKKEWLLFSRPLKPKLCAEQFGVSCSADKWLLEAHPKLDPCGTTTAGVCHGPKDIPDTVAQAECAASAASIPIHSGQVELDPYYAQCVESLCAGCGTCGGFCPGGAIKMQHFTSPQILAQIDAFFLGGEQ